MVAMQEASRWRSTTGIWRDMDRGEYLAASYGAVSALGSAARDVVRAEASAATAIVAAQAFTASVLDRGSGRLSPAKWR